ncbi:MAG TPA: cobalt-precorrin-7 (C(5))-methyltransferase, partial [Methanoregulaceae archaeon]|nr:cobalt-precorrin-7 (C(5))-methyltransferase [Methanoregulaceae archaeon]
MLTEQAVSAISDAAIIFGSKRAIALVAAHIPAGCIVREMVTFSPNQPIPDNAVILSTGDPQLAGLGYLGGEIIPGIS